jgi:indole-3-glycerol phosphate synthase
MTYLPRFLDEHSINYLFKIAHMDFEGLKLKAQIEEAKQNLKHHRDLTDKKKKSNTFKTDISTTIKLIPEIPKNKTIVSESGINTSEEIERLKVAGTHAFLIGETLMREKNIAEKLKELTRSN